MDKAKNVEEISQVIVIIMLMYANVCWLDNSNCSLLNSITLSSVN